MGGRCGGINCSGGSGCLHGGSGGASGGQVVML